MFRKLSDEIWDYLISQGFDGTSIVIMCLLLVIIVFFLVGDNKKIMNWEQLSFPEKMEAGRGALIIITMLVGILLMLFVKKQ